MIVRKKLQENSFGDFVKVVADIERNICSIGYELHTDCIEELLEDGSSGENLWGANVYFGAKKIDFVSLINIRPVRGNRTMEIRDDEIKKKVAAIIHALLPL